MTYISVDFTGEYVLHMAQKPLVPGKTATLLNFRADEELVEALNGHVEQSGRTRPELTPDSLCQYLDLEVTAS